MAKGVCVVFLAFWFVTLTSSQGTLLEMSQQLWSKLLSGGFSKTGKLEPLKVPVIKVDQSEGDTSYRIILRNVEITGLNGSTLESIHIARGRLKSNLSELEAGYVSYSDLRDLDSIRYRFHTLIKEPKTQNESFEAIVSATNQESKFKVSSADQESRFERFRQYDPFLMRIQADQMKERPADRAKTEEKSSQEPKYGTFSMQGAKVLSVPENGRFSEGSRYPADVQMIYAMSAINSGIKTGNDERKENYDQTRRGSYSGVSQDSYGEANRRENFGGRRAEERNEDVQASASENVESKVRGQDQRIVPGFAARAPVYQAEPKTLEKQPGYIDIVYADQSNNGSVKRFGNERIDSKQNARVYGLKDISKDILENRRSITYNCTEGEPLTKRNDAVKAAIETKRLDNLTRYARNYQEKEGYFEEGMQLLYHYGSMESKNVDMSQGMRHKRAHKENETDDDVMHVILKIRVPVLRIKSDYQLTGKVGNELVRGNGRLNGTFNEVTGDFTIELKKTKGQDVLIVRAARSKLKAKDQNVSLQGMDEKGPVKSILGHGLMAAEAVAAMLADDLATKALNDKTADAMIYRMYKNLPVN